MGKQELHWGLASNTWETIYGDITEYDILNIFFTGRRVCMGHLMGKTMIVIGGFRVFQTDYFPYK